MSRSVDELQQMRSLPWSEEAERAVLAAMFLDPALVPRTRDEIPAEAFYPERHQLIFNAFGALHDAGESIDLRTMQAHLERWGQHEAVGGLAYLAGLDLDLPRLENIASYVGIVRERWTRRRVIAACAEGTRQALDGSKLEALDNIAKLQLQLADIERGAVRTQGVTLGAALSARLVELEERDPGSLVGLSTGVKGLDDITLGLRAGLTVVGARPGIGKSTFAMNLGTHASLRLGLPTLMVTLEMSYPQLADRVACSVAEVNFTAYQKGHLSSGQWGKVQIAARDLSKAPFHLHAGDGSYPDVAAAIRRQAASGLALVLIDYLQLLEWSSDRRGDNRNLEISRITRSLKLLSSEISTPIVLLSQLSRDAVKRGTESRRPTLTDLRDSGAIEQDADVVIFIHRDPEDPENYANTELIVGKNRHGETGMVRSVFQGHYCRFVESATAPSRRSEAPF